MAKLSAERIFERFYEAIDDHARVTRWIREAPRGSHERQVHVNRQWAIRRRMNKYAETIERMCSAKRQA